jgi:hypothetical protein
VGYGGAVVLAAVELVALVFDVVVVGEGSV